MIRCTWLASYVSGSDRSAWLCLPSALFVIYLLALYPSIWPSEPLAAQPCSAHVSARLGRCSVLGHNHARLLELARKLRSRLAVVLLELVLR